MSHYVGLDIGTSGCKAGVINEQGELLGIGYREYAFTGSQLWQMEADASQVWQLCAASVGEAIGESAVPASEIKAIGLSVLGEACMPVDADGNPLLPGIHALDSRANYYAEYVDWWRERFGPLRVFQVTSYPLSYLPSAMKIMWVRDNHPEILERAHKYCTFQDFTVWKLTGAPAMDYAMASRTLLLDVVNHRWSEEFLSALELDQSLFSDLHESTDVVGEVTPAAADVTGLKAGTPVVVGGSDQPAVALAVGAIRDGVVMNGAGSSEAIGTPTREPIVSEDMMALGEGSQCHISKDLWLAMGFHLACGHLVKWTRNELGQLELEKEAADGDNAYDMITAQAAESPPGANGVMILPHWLGAGTGVDPCLNPDSRGTILGLSVSRTKADLYRAIFEGLCYEVRLILDSFEKAAIPIEELKVSGGGAKSPFWLQLKADITQKQVTVPAVTEASLLGAGMLAATGVGVYGSLQQAVDAVCRDVATYDPKAELAGVYDEHFGVYKELYTSLLPLNTRIRSLTDG
jgi:xylulokinase